MGQNSLGRLTAQMLIETEQGETALKRVSALSKLVATDLKSVGGLFLPNGDFKKFGNGVDEATASVKKHSDAMGEGEKALRGFYREQRLQDRTVRESKDALLGLTFGIMAVTSGLGEGSAEAKRFQMSLVGGIAAMQAGEFAAFGLGTAGRNLKGILGDLAAGASKYAGAIGAVIGLGVGLYMFFRSTRDWAKEATDKGLKNFADELDTIAGKIEVLLPAAGKMRKQVYEQELQYVTNELNAMIEMRDGIMGGKNAMDAAVGPFASAIATWLTNGFSRDEERLAKLNERIADSIKRQKELAALAGGVTITATKPLLTPDDQKKADDDAKKREEERQKAREQEIKDQGEYIDGVKGLVDYGKSLYEAGRLTTDQYIEQLKIAHEKAGDSKIALDIEKEIDRLLTDKVEKERKAAEDEKRALDYRSETIQLQYRLGKISAEKAIEELRLLQVTTADANQRLKFEQQIVDVKEAQIQKANEQLDQAARIGDLLQHAFSKSGDDFISKLNQALQIAVQIAKLMSKDDFGSPLDILEMLGNAMEILSLNTGTTGGQPNSSQRSSSAISLSRTGVSSAGNIMPNGQMYYPIKTAQRMPAGFIESRFSGMDIALESELRAIKAELVSIKNNPPTVIVKNPITLAKGLETEMPTYEQYRKNKFEN